MTATVRRVTTRGAAFLGLPLNLGHVVRATVVVAALLAGTPAWANDETIIGNFFAALNPKAILARSEPAPPAPQEVETKAAPRKPDRRPLAIQPRAVARQTAARPPRPPARQQAAAQADLTDTTGAIAESPRQSQPQPRPLAPSPAIAQVPAVPVAPAAAPQPSAKPRAEAAKPRPEAAPKPAQQAKPAAANPPAPAADSEAAQFCSNITDVASDARFSWQVRMLEDLDKQVKESTTRLEAKRAEYEDWLKRREDFLRKVEDGVVEMYGRMRPEAAAQQIASMTEEVALSVLMKLKPRASSAILSEMEPARAARLTDSLAGVRLTTQQGKTQ